MDQVRRLVRPTDVPDTGMICDLLWADPDKDIAGWAENDRGVSFIFGPDVVTSFLQKMDMDLVCRAHQVVEDGYEFFAKRQLITIFSAPNYCGEFDNAGAMMSIDESLMCSFKVLKPVKGKKMRVAPWGLMKSRSVLPRVQTHDVYGNICQQSHDIVSVVAVRQPPDRKTQTRDNSVWTPPEQDSAWRSKMIQGCMQQ